MIVFPDVVLNHAHLPHSQGKKLRDWKNILLKKIFNISRFRNGIGQGIDCSGVPINHTALLQFPRWETASLESSSRM